MAVWGLDNHTATGDAPVKFIQLFGFFLDSRRDSVGWWHVPKRDLHR